jgi:hypothetical protein
MTRRLDEIGPELAAFCRQNHAIRLSVFGSAARGEMRPNSDIDPLVEFEAGRAPSLAGLRGSRKVWRACSGVSPSIWRFPVFCEIHIDAAPFLPT